MKSGVVVIIGRPNSGKSTFFNKVLDFDLSIIAPTPQTTRNQIKGIFNDSDSQIIFMDTPGIHKPKSTFGRTLNDEAYEALKNSDLILFLTPADQKFGPGDRFILRKIRVLEIPKIALITKVDLVEKREALDVKAKKLKALGFKSVLGVSKFSTLSIQEAMRDIKNEMPEGPKYYPDENMVTDVSTRFVAKEIIREKAITNVYDEVVYSIEVKINSFDETDEEVFIEAVIYVERDSQKIILIGKKGAKVKKIGTEARQAIANFLGKKTHLNLTIKVAKNWTKNPEILESK